MYSQTANLRYCKYLWNYKTDQHEISGQYLDNENVSREAVLWCYNKSKMEAGRSFWISLNHHYLSEKSSDFDEIWYIAANIEPDDTHVTEN